jgi:DNA-nicking Smr family endonuclease
MSQKPKNPSSENWTSFIKDVVPLVHEEKVPIRKKHDTPPVTSHYVKRENLDTLMPDTIQRLIDPRHTLMDKEPRRIKTRRDPSKVHIDARLDLHGLTQDNAYAQLVPFLIRMQHRSAKWVLIITGKSGVLFEMTPKWLNALPRLVASHCHARPNHGGTGALCIAIKKISEK